MNYYPNVNQPPANQPYSYPGFSQQYQPNNNYIPIAPTNYNNQRNQSYFNQPQTYQPYTQTMNNANTTVNRGGYARHGANTNLQYNEDQFLNKDLDNTLQGRARSGFIKKVYTLLTLQLLVTIAIGYWAFNSSLFQTIFVNLPMIIILSVLLMGLSCFISCLPDLFRKFALPIFIVFTLVFSLILGITICGYKSKVVLMAAGITFLLVAALTVYAFVTKNDFTSFGPYLFVLCIVLMIFGIVCMFWQNAIVQLIYSCLSALLFSFYLIFDTQLVIGKGNYSYSLDDAYMASIQLYIDIIQLFLNLLKIIAYFSD